jgi:hypothetical protein
VANTLDAITSDRPYRPAQSLTAGRAEIERWSGWQFDPHVVKLLLDMDQNIWPDLRKAGHLYELPTPKYLPKWSHDCFGKFRAAHAIGDQSRNAPGIFVIGSAIQLSAILLLPHAAPLLEEKRRAAGLGQRVYR